MKRLAKPIIFAMPVALFVAAKGDDKLAMALGEALNLDFPGFFARYPLPIFFAGYLAFVLFDLLYGAIETYARPEREVSHKQTITILRALDRVTGDKAARFAEAARERTKIRDGHSVFNSITKPEQQLALLVAAVHGVFETLDEESTYRVGLLEINEGKPSAWAHFMPHSSPPRTTPRDLCAPTSTVMKSLKAKKAILVGDVASELKKPSKDKRRYVAGSHRPGDEGSQLCYPIVHPSTGKIEYVLTIAGDRCNCMREEHLPLYEWVIEPFALRLNLEHSLILIKERVSHVQTAPEQPELASSVQSGN